MNSESDEALMNKVKEGYLGSMSILFERYQKPLYNFFVRLSHNPELSQDLTQTAFYRAIKYRKTFKDKHSFRSWIYRLSRNLFYDDYKKQARRNESPLPEQDNEIPIEVHGVSRRTEQTKAELNDAMSQLPNDQRELLIMSKYQGLRYEEISAITGASIGAIKTRVHRAMGNLKEIYFEGQTAK